MTHLIPKLILLLGLLIVSGFFSGSETALFSLSQIEKRRLKERHPRSWKRITNLLEKPRRTLITILIGNMAVNTMAMVLATTLALDWLGTQGVAWTIAFFTIVLVLVGELIPKVFAVRNNEHIAFVSALPLDLFAKLIYPLRRGVRWVADHVLSFLIHEKRKNADLISEVELKALARIGEEEGVLRAEEGEMIQKLIGLGDRIAREIMIPRTDMIAFDIDDGRGKLIDMAKQFHFSFFPVYEGSMDNILGVISIQRFMLASEKADLKSLIESPYYVPETKCIDELLQDFQKMKRQVAICVDEHGGTAGLLTMEDVLEEIFGEFYDEYAKAEKLIKTLSKNVYLVQGKLGLHELDEDLGITLDSETSETLSGWLMERFGRIPKRKDVLKWQSITFEVESVSKQRIVSVKVTKK